MIDFDSLVLGPAQEVFARPIIVTPLKSQPPAAPYAARGIFDERPIDIAMEDDGIMSSVQISLGIRISEFQTPPVQGDAVDIPAHLSLPAVGRCLIDNVDPDGQGGAIWALKKSSA